MTLPRSPRVSRALLLAGLLASPLAAQTTTTPAQGGAQQSADPRVGLAGGWMNAKSAIRNLDHLSYTPRPERFFTAGNPGDFGTANSDLAFQGKIVFQGNFNGWQAWDISNPAKPALRASLVCPGGQGDLSVWGNLLFMSVEETRGRVDCGTEAPRDSVSRDRFRGVRIFDISDIGAPKQIAAVQTCRGSHTHTLVTDAKDSANLYVYVSGTSLVRSPSELPGCSGREPDQDPNTSFFRIEVIKVPLADPAQAAVVNTPRIFADSAGNPAGLWKGGKASDSAQATATTNQCHDITAYPAIGLAGGACAGNGILLDISDPANPKRIDEVFDPNFAYWHSATFNNDGSKVIFTDEWGGGTAPRCRATDKPEWGANALFTLTNRELKQVGYYKLPAPQSAAENCVAHNGSLIPVPGRDIMVQAWYQGGISVFDFTDPAKPVEIAYFDRGPVDSAKLTLAGSWSAYWYNGMIVSSEIARGLDLFALKPSEFLSQNEIDAAKSVVVDRANPQLQTRITWAPGFAVARAYVDQLERSQGIAANQVTRLRAELDRAERGQGATRRTALTQLAAQLERDAAGAQDGAKVRSLAGVVRELAGGAAQGDSLTAPQGTPQGTPQGAPQGTPRRTPGRVTKDRAGR